MYDEFIAQLRKVNPLVKVVGFSATPYRLGQGKLTDPINLKGGKTRPSIFTDVCYDLTDMAGFSRLIEEGFLCPLVPKRPGKEIDTSRVKVHGGEFNQVELQAAADRDSITKAAIDEMMSQGADRKHWLIFATGVEHADHVAAELNRRGITAASIHSKMSGDRGPILQAFKRGEIRAVVNNDVLTTGYDGPFIDLIGDLQPTCSPAKHVQKYGRGTRPFPGKQNCLVLDFAGNVRRLGPINDPVLPRARGKKGGGHAPVKCCEACGMWNHASARECVSCKAPFPISVKFEAVASELDLLAGQEARFETMRVDSVEYVVHTQRSTGIVSLKVTYWSGQRAFNEFVCLEHEHRPFVRHQAREWWRKRTGREAPDSVADAMGRLSELATPTHIRVWVNTKHPEVRDHDFTGSAFAGKFD